MFKRIYAVLFALGLVAAVPTGALAQRQVTVTGPPSELLRNLYGSAIVETVINIDLALPVINDVLADFGLPPINPDPNRIGADLAQDLASAFVLTSAIGNELSTFPMGSSAGGFSWTYDPAMGTFNRASESFGPLFADRALTLGRGRFSAGVNFQRASFDTFEGQDLGDGEVQFFSEVVGEIPTDNDVSFLYTENTLDMQLSTNTVGLFFNYGVMDRLDVGVALPIVNVSVDAALRQRLLLFDGQAFDDVQFLGSASATGIGDITLRGKYRFLDAPGGGLAAAADLRLPTGDERELLGIPGTQLEIFLIGSSAFSRIAPHFNVGYTISRANDLVDPNAVETTPFLIEPPEELNFAGGVDVAVSPRVTVAGDILLRRLRDTAKLTLAESEVGPAFQEFRTMFPEGVTVSYGSVGLKINAWETLLITGNVLFPLSDGGLQDNLMPTIGVDYSF